MDYMEIAVFSSVVVFLGLLYIARRIGYHDGYRKGWNECRTYYIGDDSGEKEEGWK
jgi:hypothetical protein